MSNIFANPNSLCHEDSIIYENINSVKNTLLLKPLEAHFQTDTSLSVTFPGVWLLQQL